MKEICIINYASNAANYGIGTYIKEYLHCLANIGCKVNLIELGMDSPNQGIYLKEKRGVRTICIPYIRKDMATYNKSVCHLLRLYFKDSPDLVFHFQYLQSDSLLPHIKKYFPLSKSVLTVHYQYWGTKLKGNLLAYKSIMAMRNYKSVIKKHYDLIAHYKREKEFVHAVDKVVCLAEDTYNLFNELYDTDKNKFVLIPNGLIPHKKDRIKEKQDKIREQYHVGENEKIILFVGRIDEGKGVIPLLLAFGQVIDKYPLCRLILIGDGEIVNMLKHVSHFATQITFIGKLNKKELCRWYCIADVGVFPSFHEECSYVGIEMLMHGLPIVSSDGYAVRNMFDVQNALIAHVGNYDKPENFTSEFSESILTLLNSKELSKLKSEQSLHMYKKVYHLKYMQQKYAAMLTKL